MGKKTYASGYADERNKKVKIKNDGENHVLKALSAYSKEEIQRKVEEFKNRPKRKKDPTGRTIYAKVLAKMQVSQPQDEEEVQADKVAEGVMKGNTDHSKKALSEKTGNEISAKGEGDVTQTSDAFDAKLQSTKGQGQKLDEKTKGELEQHTGTDLGGVNIHTHSDAGKMSEDINAKAFTHGQDIYFKEGHYSPNSKDGKELLAHEVAHTVQQEEGKVQMKVQRQANYNEGKIEVSPPSEQKDAGNIIYYVYAVKYTGHFSLREFMIEFLSSIYSIDTNTAGVLLVKIEQQRQKSGDTLENFWSPDFDSLDYTPINNKPMDTMNFRMPKGTYETWKTLLTGKTEITAETESYSESQQKILSEDTSKLPNSKRSQREQLKFLISQISPAEWATAEAYEGLPDDLFIEYMIKYLNQRNKLLSGLKAAVKNKKPGDATKLLQATTAQTLTGIPFDLRVNVLKLFCESKDVDGVDEGIILLMQTVPDSQLQDWVGKLLENNGYLIQYLTYDVKDKLAEYMELIRAYMFAIDPEKVAGFLTRNIKAPVDAKKVLPWLDPTSGLSQFAGAERIAYEIGFAGGKLHVKYWKTYPKSDDWGGPSRHMWDQAYYKENANRKNDPLYYGELDLDFMEPIILEHQQGASFNGPEAGQRIVIPAIMLLSIQRQTNKEALKNFFTFGINAAFFAFGVGEMALAKNFFQFIWGALNAASAVISQYRDDLRKSEAGKLVVAYNDMFMIGQGSYLGLQLLVKAPQVYAGMVKAWQMFKLANNGDELLTKMATIDTNIEKLNKQLQEYIASLKGVKKTRAEQKIFAEETRVAMLGGPLRSSFLVDVLVQHLLIAIKRGFLKANATIQEIKTYLKQQEVYKELASLDEATYTTLVNDAKIKIVAEQVNALKETVKGLGRVRSGKPSYPEFGPLNDDEVIVFTRVPSAASFKVRPDKDVMIYGDISTPRPSKSVSIAVTLDITEEVPAIFPRPDGLRSEDVLYATTAREIREAGFDVIYHPTNNNNWHASIIEKTSEASSLKKLSKFDNQHDVEELIRTFKLIAKANK